MRTQVIARRSAHFVHCGPEGQAAAAAVETQFVERAVLIADEQHVAGLGHDRSQHGRGQQAFPGQLDFARRPEGFGKIFIEQDASPEANLGVVVDERLFQPRSVMRRPVRAGPLGPIRGLRPRAAPSCRTSRATRTASAGFPEEDRAAAGASADGFWTPGFSGMGRWALAAQGFRARANPASQMPHRVRTAGRIRTASPSILLVVGVWLRFETAAAGCQPPQTTSCRLPFRFVLPAPGCQLAATRGAKRSEDIGLGVAGQGGFPAREARTGRRLPGRCGYPCK